MEEEPGPQEYEDIVRACEMLDDGIHWNGDGRGERNKRDPGKKGFFLRAAMRSSDDCQERTHAFTF